jgi:hypothetical protein
MKKKSNTPICLGGPALALRVAAAVVFMTAGSAILPAVVEGNRSIPTLTNDVPSFPPEGDGKGIVVRLEVPWKVLLEREDITFYYVLENRSDAPIPVAFPFGEPFGWPNGGQAFLEGILAPGSPEPGGMYSEVDFPWLKVAEAAWPPIDTEGKIIDVWGYLPVGQRVVWNRNRLRAEDYFRVHSSQYLRAIQGHWLVGNGRWVSSEPVAVEVRDVPESQWSNVFEGEWSSYGRGLDRRVTRVNKIPLDGKWFLFSDFMVRICEVGEKDEFEFKIEPEIGQLVVTVKSPAAEKKHYYHMQHGLTRDSPWKAGPVSQYYPVPEPIPEADLALPVLATKVATNGEKPGEASTVEAAGCPLWPWILGILMLTLALLLAWTRLRGRKS